MFPFFANRIINVWNYILSTVNFISLAGCRRSSHLISLSANLKYNVARALFNRFYSLVSATVLHGRPQAWSTGVTCPPMKML